MMFTLKWKLFSPQVQSLHGKMQNVAEVVTTVEIEKKKKLA